MRGITDILSTLTLLFPPWLLAALVVVVALYAVPAWYDGMREKQIRGLLRRRSRADGDLRQQLAQRATELAGTRARRVVVLATEAAKYGQHDLLRAGHAQLVAIGAHPADIRRVAALIRDEPKTHGTALEACVVIERMLEEGMLDTAKDRLGLSLSRFPNDPELTALQDRIHHASYPPP